MAISAAIAAERKEPIIVALVACIVTAGPPASGAIAEIAATNSRSRIVLPANGFGTTWTRARPSGRTQSRASSDGMVCKLTGRAPNALRSWSSSLGRNRVSAWSTATSTGSGAAASFFRSSAIALST